MKKNTLNILERWVITAAILVLFTFAVSCDTDVYEITTPPDTSGETPVIASVDPPDSVLAGITEITITGSNFSTDITKNIVYFDNISANILQVSPTELVVRAPLYIKDSVIVKVAVQGVELFSGSYMLHLKPAVVEIFGDGDNVPSGITSDISGNLYFNLEAFGLNVGLKRFTPTGVVEDFAGRSGSFYIELKYGNDGRVYGTRSPTVRAVFANAEGGNPSAITVANSTAKLISFDFDNNYNLWTGGTGGDIYRITPDGSDKLAFTFEPEITSLRFFNGYLYVAAKDDSIKSVYKIQVVDSDNLGTPEVYFDVSSNLPGLNINAVTFANDGRMFLGTDAEKDDPNVLVVVNPDGSFSSWYPGVVTGPIASFAWDTGDFLYYVREAVGTTQTQMIMRINMVTAGAPHYGRD
jgi:IPT/TIG domain-containing protein